MGERVLVDLDSIEPGIAGRFLRAVEQYPCARRGIELFLGINDAATRLYEDLTMSLLQKWVEASLDKESQKPERTGHLTIRLIVNDHPVLKPRN